MIFLQAILLYLAIGYVVSFTMLYIHRNTRPVRRSDAFAGIIGPVIWPAQIIYHFYLKTR